jgi:hypothetical protein
MTRGLIRAQDTAVITDNGSLSISVVEGEQWGLDFTLGWLSDLTGYTITAKAVEALNVDGDLRVVPTEEAATPQIVSLPIIDTLTTDNIFTLVIPDDLTSSWDVTPGPDDPVFAYFAVQVADAGVGDAQQIWVPVRGIIEVLYNPVRTV